MSAASRLAPSLALGLLVSPLLTPPALAGPKTITIEAATPAAGQVVRIERDFGMSLPLKVTMAGAVVQEGPVTFGEVEKATVTVVRPKQAAEGAWVTVDLHERVSSSGFMTPATEEPSALQGQSFDLKVAPDGTTSVQTTQGEAVPSGAAGDLKPHLKVLEGFEPVADAWIGRAITVGQVLPIEDGLLPAGISNGEDGWTTEGTVTLTKVRRRKGRRRAEFDLAVQASRIDPANGMQMQMVLEGTFAVEPEQGRMVAMELHGTTTLSAAQQGPNGQGLVMAGEGPVHMTQTFDYTDP